MKSLNVIKNNFRTNELLNNSFSSKIKGGAGANAIDPTVDPSDPGTTAIIGEPWDKRTPRPGTKK
jgi:hypothetical protein